MADLTSNTPLMTVYIVSEAEVVTATATTAIFTELLQLGFYWTPSDVAKETRRIYFDAPKRKIGDLASKAMKSQSSVEVISFQDHTVLNYLLLPLHRLPT